MVRSNKTLNGNREEKIIGFSPRLLKAPFFLRCAAILVDYLLLISIPMVWLLLSKFLSDPSLPPTLGPIVWFLVLIAFLVDFILFPLIVGQTAGKMVFGLTIVKSDGSRLNLMSIVIRNLLGYLLTIVTFGVGFFISAANSSGRSLHDLIAGTTVVRGNKVKVV